MWPRRTLGLQLSDIVWSFCLSISDLAGLWGFGFMVFYGLPVCLFRASRDFGASTVGYDLVFLSVNLRPWRILGLQLSAIGWSCWLLMSGLVCQCRASRDSGAWSLCLLVTGVEGFWGPRCQELTIIFVCKFLALKDSGAPAAGCCLVLSVNFRPRGIPGFLLSGKMYVNFRPGRILGLQLSGVV